MNQLLFYPIALPIIAGLICLILPPKTRGIREFLALVIPLATLLIAIVIYRQGELRVVQPWFSIGPGLAISIDLMATPFARLALIIAAAFSCLVALYSLQFMQNHPRKGEYYAYLLASLGGASGVLLANHFVLLLFFWELLGFMLYLMVMISGSSAASSATKALVIAVTGDMALLLGFAFYWLEHGNLIISELVANPILLTTPFSMAAYLLMMVGAFAKAGVIPLHTWIPAISTQAVMPVMSLFTSLDKLIGIYLLAALTLNWFVITPWLSVVLMIIGAATLLACVLMAMIQHDFRRMLAFHNISQVGYMVLGIGTGVPLGIIGGIFHMVNMIVLKGSLFLCGGSVQQQTKRTEFDELGGLAKAMPWTFVSMLVAALGISGVPPLNAFVSKWFIYQGIMVKGGGFYPILLVIAMFGSALTLASFMKLMYSVFWGNRPNKLDQVKESGPGILIPILMLALFAIGFGIFYQWPVDLLIKSLGLKAEQAVIPGFWQSGKATILLILSLLAGVPIYLLSRTREAKETEVFVGGEALDHELYRVSGTHFYGPIKEFTGLKQLLTRGEQGDFDLYNHVIRFVNWGSNMVYQYFDQALNDFYREVVPSFISLVGQLLRLLNARLILTQILWLLYAISALGVLFMPQNQSILPTVRILACIGMIGWGILASVETDLRRLLVFATTSQLGIVVLALTVSSSVAISCLITGSLGLATMFLLAYLIRKSLNTWDIYGMKGLAVRQPVLFLVFLLAALWLSGLPPLGNFFSKYLLGVSVGKISPMLSIVITLTALITLYYLIRPIQRFLQPD
jgi:formate hydrogenlyase subunit 3/multisubunit Na+/H+ antiporter MnhD subunit